MKRLSTAVIGLCISAPAWANPITYRDVAPDSPDTAAYRNVGALREAELAAVSGQLLSFPEWLERPYKPNGSPGIAIFDYDGDGDLDIYVANGPGAANSLFANQLRETGSVSFVDQAAAAGVTATAQESSGVIAGDIDNDGDQDLLVLGAVDHNILFENQGDGTFIDITASAGIAGNLFSGSASATMGDVNGDGLLDIFIGNCHDLLSMIPIFTFAPQIIAHNQLFLNRGNNVFEDVTASAGLLATRGHVDAAGTNLNGIAGISWAVTMFDYDQDGDLDIFTLDDQGALPSAAAGGWDSGLIHVWENDGTGHFVDVNVERGLNKTGAWMGISIGDFDANGHLDFFGSNFGDTNVANALQAPLLGVLTSRWFLNNGDGTFFDPVTPNGLPGLISLPFGWGTSAYDYDNDGDTDILFHGDMDDAIEFISSNPGVLLDNDGSANFTANESAFVGSAPHQLRNVTGVATGDLDEDGFIDIVTVSTVDLPEEQIMPNPWDFGGPYDDTDGFIFAFFPQGDIFNGAPLLLNDEILNFPDGTLAIELSSANNGNRSASVKPIGTVGLTTNGRNNRDGVGAVLTFTPDGHAPAMSVVTAGSSFSSTHSRLRHFGMGQARRGTVDILWPGGVRNRRYNVRPGTTVRQPEIPCSYDAPRFLPYAFCVARALHELQGEGVISSRERRQLRRSAFRAWFEEHR